jgi:hypothetical protein
MLDLTIPVRRDPGLTDGARDDLIEAQGELERALPILEQLESLLRNAEFHGADVEWENECQEIRGSINGAIEDISDKVGEE